MVIRDCTSNITNDQKVENLVSMNSGAIDINRYYDSITCLYVYPKYNLKKSINNTLYLNENVLFDSTLIPDNSNSLFYEILNDSILVITFFDINLQKGLSHPMLYKREFIYFIKLNEPYFIYKTDFNGRYIVGDKETFIKLSLPRSDSDDWKFHYIIKFHPPKLLLKATTGEIDTIGMKRVINPLMRSAIE